MVFRGTFKACCKRSTFKMNSKKIIMGVIAAGLVASVYFSFFGNDDQAYIGQIKKEREAKDAFMANATDSPFGDGKAAFAGLKYFPPDVTYRITANITPIKTREVRVLNTSDANTQSFLTYAWADFDLDALHHRLLILEVMEGEERGKLFLAFGDATSANETYGAGRYLDVRKVPGAAAITLDFNQAYNPYCAYTEKYSCPFPPPENFLKAAIRAGERTYK